MSQIVDPVLIVALTLNFVALGVSRIRAVINAVALQGILLGENGIFVFGLLLLEAMLPLVEVGVLLDLFTVVFVMGIIIHHISREFASMSTEHLTELKE